MEVPVHGIFLGSETITSFWSQTRRFLCQIVQRFVGENNGPRSTIFYHALLYKPMYRHVTCLPYVMTCDICIFIYYIHTEIYIYIYITYSVYVCVCVLYHPYIVNLRYLPQIQKLLAFFGVRTHLTSQKSQKNRGTKSSYLTIWSTQIIHT